MTDFQHSIVLFSGDDGLPLEFNTRNTSEKVRLKAIIEHGGGLVTQSDNAVHLISPGTKVLNADLGKKLVSTRYIFDCVKENYLLDVNDYVFVITEAETSDISDESNQAISTKPFRLADIAPFKKSLNCDDEEEDLISEDDDKSLKDAPNERDMDFALQIVSAETMKDLNSSAGSSESFIASSMPNEFKPKSFCFDNRDIPLTSTAKEPEAVHISENLEEFGISPIQGSQSIVHPEILALYKRGEESKRKSNKETTSAVETVVSSTQQVMGALDHFDNLLLNKIQQKPEMEVEDSVPQSCTVSSSGDLAISSIPPSVEIQPCEGAESVPPDSLGSSYLLQDRYLYIKKLESEIEEILKKPSPKSIQDKITLVKYICLVKKLTPLKVLTELRNL